jgi:hypothetical protein
MNEQSEHVKKVSNSPSVPHAATGKPDRNKRKDEMQFPK